jgi:hypothetical protein
LALSWWLNPWDDFLDFDAPGLPGGKLGWAIVARIQGQFESLEMTSAGQQGPRAEPPPLVDAERISDLCHVPLTRTCVLTTLGGPCGICSALWPMPTNAAIGVSTVASLKRSSASLASANVKQEVMLCWKYQLPYGFRLIPNLFQAANFYYPFFSFIGPIRYNQ